MWRINWIHPFSDGNGRTARIISYIILCAKYGYRLPGTKTIPERIAGNKAPYYQALEKADSAYASSDGRTIDVSAMESIIESGLREQLEGALAQSKKPDAGANLKEAPVYNELLLSKQAIEDQSVVTVRFIKDDGDKNFIERNPVLFNFFSGLIVAIIAFALGRFF